MFNSSKFYIFREHYSFQNSFILISFITTLQSFSKDFTVAFLEKKAGASGRRKQKRKLSEAESHGQARRTQVTIALRLRTHDATPPTPLL